MIGNWLDSFIGIFSPRVAANRVAYRGRISQLRAAAGTHEAMRKMLGGHNDAGYEAGRQDRLKGRGHGAAHENDVPRDQIARLRWRAWKLYRNNPQARKICRSLGAKVVGRGLSPQPQTVKADGSPFVDFRKRARQVWEEFVKEADFRGKPGRGGQHLTALAKSALRATILSGGALYRFRHLDKAQQQKLGLSLPLQVQLMHVDRLDDSKNGDSQFYGLDLDAENKTVGYWILRGGSASADDGEKSVRVPASEMGHLFAEEDIDQLLGSPWVGAAMLTMDDRRQYEYNEIVAAEMAACTVAGYRRSTGQVGDIGLQGPDGERDLTDANGNPVTRLQPGMFLDLGQTGHIELLNPARPNASAEGFLSHLVRSEAVSVPGVKSSTLTGDYRNSSFSSERSADNDIWPEVEEIQDWFAGGFYQPIYEEVITTAVLAGAFDGVAGFNARDFAERRRDYLKTNWQGPVPRSINPKDDADASRGRVRNLQSTPQREAAKEGTDWRDNIDAAVEFIAYCKERGLPDDLWQQALGIDQSDSTPAQAPAPTEQEQDEAMAVVRHRLQDRLGGFVALNSAGGGK
jgi:lambda family phage portal protein